MKISTQCFTLIYLCSFASAERVVRVLFNQGLVPDINDYCNSTSDVQMLDLLFNTTARRHLRVHNELNHENIGELNSERELYPIYCKSYCRGYVKGTCRVTNCKGFRRELTDTIDDPYNVTCPGKIGLVNHTLNALVQSDAVSPSCQRLLQKPRTFECFDDRAYGEIEYINVYKVTTLSTLFNKDSPSINEPDKAVVVCKNSAAYYRIRVGVNLCVETMVANVTDPSGKTESYPFGQYFFHTFDWLFFPKSEKVLLGKHVNNYIPDGILSKSKSLVFDVRKKC